jgi:hypothetical protein
MITVAHYIIIIAFLSLYLCVIEIELECELEIEIECVLLTNEKKLINAFNDKIEYNPFTTNKQNNPLIEYIEKIPFILL